MASTPGRCSNADYCSIADRRLVLQVPAGGTFACPECGKPLHKVAPAAEGGRNWGMMAAGVAALLAGGGVLAYILLPAGHTAPTAAPPHIAAMAPVAAPAAVPKPAAAPAVKLAVYVAPPTVPADNVVLRLSGSNTVGAVLGPKLAQAFLMQTGDTGVTITPSGADEVKVSGERGTVHEEITVAAHGSATAFTDLTASRADVGMASRRVKAAEAAPLGDMTSSASEHVLALDGIAVIVNPGNPIGTLTRAQLRGVFSGTISNWSQLGGANAPIHVFARDDKSGTYDTFKSLVLNGAALDAHAARVEDSRELSSRVTADPDAIGFIGLPYILSAKAVAVADTGAAPLLPNRLTVGTEDYALARRLFLYTVPSRTSAIAQRFVEFALSPQGQDIVNQTGFVPLTIQPEAAPVPETASTKYRQLVARAARLSTNFRFKSNSVDLDNRAQRDLDRLVNFLVSMHAQGSRIILVGFTDNVGSSTSNVAMSKKRAEAVASQLAQRGVRVGQIAAFGSDLPVADNGSNDGREKNRRVEVYLQS